MKYPDTLSSVDPIDLLGMMREIKIANQVPEEFLKFVHEQLTKSNTHIDPSFVRDSVYLFCIFALDETNHLRYAIRESER